MNKHVMIFALVVTVMVLIDAIGVSAHPADPADMVKTGMKMGEDMAKQGMDHVSTGVKMGEDMVKQGMDHANTAINKAKEQVGQQKSLV